MKEIRLDHAKIEFHHDNGGIRIGECADEGATSHIHDVTITESTIRFRGFDGKFHELWFNAATPVQVLRDV